MNILLLTMCFVNFIIADNIVINLSGKSKAINKFWRSTGLCPPDPKTEIDKFLLSADERLNLALIGSLPNRGIKQVRIHWLINLIKYSHDTHNMPQKYDFYNLDSLLDWMQERRLQPRFELMGLPLGVNIPNGSIYEFWREITKNIAKHYIDLIKNVMENDFNTNVANVNNVPTCSKNFHPQKSEERYGVKEVEKWKFETWNEPDLKSYNILNFTLDDYLSYVNGCFDGLGDAFTKPKFGGPAGLFKRPEKHPLCWGLLENCNRMNESGCVLGYISFHKKGEGSIETLMNGTLELLDYIHFKYANLRGLPIANDEADILQNWSKSEDWRGDTRYASMIIQVIIAFYKSVVLKRNKKIEVLSNDNGFLNYHPYYFTQRTLLARFQMNNTNPPHIQFFRKPVYIAMGLLSLLGEKFLEQTHTYSSVSVLATRSDVFKTYTVVIVNANNTQQNERHIKYLNVQLTNLTYSNCKYTMYLLDNQKSNPFLTWKNAGSPVFPSNELRSRMRSVEEARRLQDPTRIIGNSLRVEFNLTLPSIVVLHVCSKDSKSPGRVSLLPPYNITWSEVLLLWKDNNVKSRCIQTYEVEFSSMYGNDSYFKRINKDDTIFLSYHYSPVVDNGSQEITKGVYRVRAIDFWGRVGRYSKRVHYP